ncbi:MAG: TolC family protein [Candidatus Longimicrobiales bacterium M2_2A_002]
MALVLVSGGVSGAAAQQDSLDLAGALEIGRERSPSLVAADARLRVAHGRADIARSAALPAVTSQAGYLRYQDPPAVDLGGLGGFALLDTDTYFAGLRAEQPLYTSGRLTAARDAAGSAADAARWGRSQVEVELTAAIARAYYDALLARSLVAVAEQGAAVLGRALGVARAHYDEGTVARLDVLRAETRVSEAELGVRSSEIAAASAGERLAAIIGITPERAPPVMGELRPDSQPPITGWDPSDLAERLRRDRPDLRALSSVAEAAEARRRVARAERRPAIGLFLSGYALNPELLTTENGWGLELMGGVSVSWPVFDGGRADGAAASAEAGAAQARAEAEQTVLTALVAARAHQRELVTILDEVDERTANAVRAEEALAIAEDRYANGVGIQLDVLEAEAQLTRARTDRLRAIHAYRTTLIELKRVLGLPADATLREPKGDRG